MSRSGAHSSQIMVVEMIFMLDICREAVPRHHDGYCIIEKHLHFFVIVLSHINIPL